MPGGDVAELVSDSRGNSWGRWYTAGTGSWSAWWRVPGKPGTVALAGPYAGPGEAAGSTEAALVTVFGRSPDDRTWYRLSAAGLVFTTL